MRNSLLVVLTLFVCLAKPSLAGFAEDPKDGVFLNRVLLGLLYTMGIDGGIQLWSEDDTLDDKEILSDGGSPSPSPSPLPSANSFFGENNTLYGLVAPTKSPSPLPTPSTHGVLDQGDFNIEMLLVQLRNSNTEESRGRVAGVILALAQRDDVPALVRVRAAGEVLSHGNVETKAHAVVLLLALARSDHACLRDIVNVACHALWNGDELVRTYAAGLIEALAPIANTSSSRDRVDVAGDVLLNGTPMAQAQAVRFLLRLAQMANAPIADIVHVAHSVLCGQGSAASKKSAAQLLLRIARLESVSIAMKVWAASGVLLQQIPELQEQAQEVLVEIFSSENVPTCYRANAAGIVLEAGLSEAVRVQALRLFFGPTQLANMNMNQRMPAARIILWRENNEGKEPAATFLLWQARRLLDLRKSVYGFNEDRLIPILRQFNGDIFIPILSDVLMRGHDAAQAEAVELFLEMTRLEHSLIGGITILVNSLLKGTHAAQGNAIKLLLGLAQLDNVPIIDRVSAASLALLNGNDETKARVVTFLFGLAQSDHALIDGIRNVVNSVLNEGGAPVNLHAERLISALEALSNAAEAQQAAYVLAGLDALITKKP
jgi:hypothetical protein